MLQFVPFVPEQITLYYSLKRKRLNKLRPGFATNYTKDSNSQ